MKNIYSGEDAPCKDCPDRQPGCHPNCDEYLLYQRRREEARKERARTREIAEVQYFASMRRQSSRRKR